MKNLKLFTLCLLILSNSFVSIAVAEVIVAPTPGNLLTVTVQSNVVSNPNTKMYTYNYTITNNSGSQQEMWFFAVDISTDAQISNSTSPQGWRFGKHMANNMVSWGAVEVGEIPEGYVDDGSTYPSAFNIKPGETLSGFSFQTLNAPGDATFYAQGFKKMVVVSSESDFETFDVQALPFTEDSYINTTISATKSMN